MTADNIAGQVAGAEVPSLALAWGEGICETTSHALVVVVSLSVGRDNNASLLHVV